jgi:predicted Zn-dependent peptidase
MYTSNGAVGFNAATSKDKTGYFVELPSSKLELWAKIESDRLKNAVFREFYTERNNVYEERLMRYDSSGEGLLYEEFIAQAFIAHPYRHPIIGWGSGIPFLSLRDMKKFYQEYYIPSRMTITIVGKQDIEKTFAVVSDHFGTIEKRPEPLPIAVKEPRQRGEKRFELYFESNPYIMIGWHKPTYPDRNDFVFDIISDILAGGKSSRLYRSLVLEKKMVSDIEISTGWPGSRYDNLFVIIAAPNNGYSTADIEKAIYDELAHLAADVSEQGISKVVTKIESEMVFGLSTNSGIAHLVSYYQTIFGDWRYAVSYLKIIRELTVSDVKQVVQTYLVPDNRTVGVLNDSRKRDK